MHRKPNDISGFDPQGTRCGRICVYLGNDSLFSLDHCETNVSFKHIERAETAVAVFRYLDLGTVPSKHPNKARLILNG